MQAQSYSMGVDVQELLQKDEEQRASQFEQYIVREATKIVEQLPKKLSSSDWKVLHVLIRDKSGLCGPGEYKDFGYKTMPSLLARVKALVAARFVEYSADENDGRQRIISATNIGRLAVLARPESTDGS